MSPRLLPPAGEIFGRRGFTLAGSLASLALFAGAVAVCVPLVVKRLRTHAAAADETARRVEAAVTRGLASVGKLADAYDGLPAPAPSDLPAAALPDGPRRAPLPFPEPWDGPPSSPFVPPCGEKPLFFGRPFFPRPGPWRFYARPLWRAGGGRRR